MFLLQAPNSWHLHQWPRQFAELIPVDSLILVVSGKNNGCGAFSG
jgi:hypothetical protein